MKKFKYIGTVTGRTTSKVSNMTEVKRGPKSKFTSDPKRVLIECDFSIFDRELNIKYKDAH